MQMTEMRVHRWLPAVIGFGWCGFGVFAVVQLARHGFSSMWLAVAVVGFAGGLVELWLAFRAGGPGIARFFTRSYARQQERLGVGTTVARDVHAPAAVTRGRLVGIGIDAVALIAFAVLTATRHHPSPALIAPIAVLFVIGIGVSALATHQS